MPVNSTHRAYDHFLRQWERVRDCYEGSDAVKDRGTRYLPKLDSHKEQGNEDKYDEYCLRALFYNATARTIEGLGGSIFQKPPTIRVPKDVEPHTKDITLSGESLEIFALTASHEVLKTGRYGILVEMSDVPSVDARPYWVGFQAENILNWKSERINGDEILTRVVLSEEVEIPDDEDEFVDECVEQIRVLEVSGGIYTQTVWQKKESPEGKKDEWVIINQIIPLRRGKTLSFIPFIFCSPNSTSPAVKKPPLLDLADVNLSHYRTMADLEHGRHYVALPTPWVRGIKDDEGELSIGSGTAWVLGETGAAGMLEFTGQGLKALETADQEKRKMMATLGARLLEDQPKAAETASAVGMRHGGDHATLRTIAQTLEQAFSLALQWHGWWFGVEEFPRDVDGALELNKEFFTLRMTSEDLRAWVESMQTGAISYETFYEGLKRGDQARPGVTVEQELADIKKHKSEVSPPASTPVPKPTFSKKENSSA